LEYGWTLKQHPSLEKYVNQVLDDFATRSPRDALAARDALDASDALDALDARDALDANESISMALASIKRFASWCVQCGGWWWRFDLSWIAITHIGALQTNNVAVQKWSGPALEAFIAGAWILHWTESTLYWVAKPTVHVEKSAQGIRRLHNEKYAALESDVENLYFWHGVLVPAFVVVRPNWITLKHIDMESNAEVRRVMMERYGYERYMADCGAKVIDEFPADYPAIGMRTARLLYKDVKDDEPICYVDMLNSTPEPDGSVKRYLIRVDPNAYDGAASKSLLAGMASTWRDGSGGLLFKRPQDYQPLIET
jgi:hypothetical protein